MLQPLNVGMIGYGFMGKAHSNAYAQVNHFFDLEYHPVLKAVYGQEFVARALAEQLAQRRLVPIGA
jgi:predicted dehydrogenase